MTSPILKQTLGSDSQGFYQTLFGATHLGKLGDLVVSELHSRTSLDSIHYDALIRICIIEFYVWLKAVMNEDRRVPITLYWAANEGRVAFSAYVKGLTQEQIDTLCVALPQKQLEIHWNLNTSGYSQLCVVLPSFEAELTSGENVNIEVDLNPAASEAVGARSSSTLPVSALLHEHPEDSVVLPETEIRGLRHRLKIAEQQLTAQFQLIEKTKDQIHTLTESLTRIKETQAKSIDTLDTSVNAAEVEALAEENRELRAQIQTLQSGQSRLQASHLSELQVLRTRVDLSTKQIEELKKTNIELGRKLAEERKEKPGAIRNGELRERLEQVTQTAAEYQLRITELERELSTLKKAS